MKLFFEEYGGPLIFVSVLVLLIAFLLSFAFETHFGFIVQEKQITSDGYVLVIDEYRDHPFWGRYLFRRDREIVTYDIYCMYSVGDVVNYDDRNECIILKILN